MPDMDTGLRRHGEIIKHLFSLYSCMLGIMLLAAYTQEPAPVDNLGGRYYGREHQGALDDPNHDTYPEESPHFKEAYTHPVQAAPAPTVGVSDLAPPSPASSRNAGYSGGYSQAQPASQSLTSQPVEVSQPATTSAGANTAVTSGAAAAPPAAAAIAAPQAASTAEGQYIWPVSGGKVISHFGPKAHGASNDGINIAVDEGEPIYAVAGGKVVYAGNELQGYGNMVIIRHPDGMMSAYAHAHNINVKKGDTVKQGDLLGNVGTTGGVKTPQLHFALRNGRTPVDPEKYLPANNG